MDADSEDGDYGEQRRLWTQEQARLRGLLVLHDDFPGQVSPSLSELHEPFRFVGGVDLSFSKLDPAMACAALVVIDIASMDVIYEDLEITRLRMPYMPGFLAFRESPVLLALLAKLQKEHVDRYPQVLMVDGNGVLHPRGFGLACHVGVLANIPTIGVAKNLHHVDGLCREDVRMASCDMADDAPLIGKSGQVLGMSLRSHSECTKPIFVSVGHRISLETAVSVVRKCCKYRIPEPVRQADIRSRKQIKSQFGS